MLVILFPISAAAVDSVRIATPVWDGYTNEDGTGFYHQLFEAIFGPKNVKTSFIYTPFTRAQKLILEGGADAVPAAYAEPARGTVYPHWHMGTDFVSALYKESVIPEWRGQDSLAGKTVGWVRGYQFDEFGVVTADVNRYRLRTIESGLKMLKRDRIDVLLDYESEISPAAEKIGLCISCEFISENTLPGLKLYMEFANSEKGRALAKIFDEGMEKLYQQGKLQKWFLQYDGAEYIHPDR